MEELDISSVEDEKILKMLQAHDKRILIEMVVYKIKENKKEK
ncbi:MULTISPECIES: hypothetical protein [unclassified Campylobacter]|nr:MULTISPECIES: hypothetical protein [unclassified Campylobacter]